MDREAFLNFIPVDILGLHKTYSGLYTYVPKQEQNSNLLSREKDFGSLLIKYSFFRMRTLKDKKWEWGK